MCRFRNAFEITLSNPGQRVMSRIFCRFCWKLQLLRSARNGEIHRRPNTEKFKTFSFVNLTSYDVRLVSYQKQLRCARRTKMISDKSFRLLRYSVWSVKLCANRKYVSLKCEGLHSKSAYSFLIQLKSDIPITNVFLKQTDGLFYDRLIIVKGRVR